MDTGNACHPPMYQAFPAFSIGSANTGAVVSYIFQGCDHQRDIISAWKANRSATVITLPVLSRARLTWLPDFGVSGPMKQNKALH
jgi:hypothetical protein